MTESNYFETIMVGEQPKFASKVRCHWRTNKAGDKAIIQFYGNQEDFDEASADLDTTLLAYEEALALAETWEEE